MFTGIVISTSEEMSPPPTDLIESYSYVTLLHQKLFYMDDEKLHLHGRTSDDVGKKKQSTWPIVYLLMLKTFV